MISDAGVTSNAGLSVRVPAGALGTPWKVITSAAPRSSISTAVPSGVARSMVDSGATTTNGTPAWRAAERERERPDLVRGVAVGRDPVGPDEHDVGEAPREHGRRRAVHEEAERRAHLLQLPGGEPRALEQRPRLERQRLLEQATPVELADDPERRAALDRREGARVADRHRPDGWPRHEAPDEVGAARRHGGTRRDVLVADGERLLEDRHRAIAEAGEGPVHAPAKVDGGRPGGAQGGGIGPDPVGITGLAGSAGEQRHAHRARHAQRRRAAHRESPDGVDERVQRRDPEHDELVREAGLVDQLDPAVDPVDGARHRPIFAGGHGTLGHRTPFTGQETTMSDLIAQALSILRTSVDRWAAIASVDPSLLARQPEPGEWSAIQALQHAVDTELEVYNARVLAIRAGSRSRASTRRREAMSAGSRGRLRSSSSSCGRCARRASPPSRRSCRRISSGRARTRSWAG